MIRKSAWAWWISVNLSWDAVQPGWIVFWYRASSQSSFHFSRAFLLSDLPCILNCRFVVSISSKEASWSLRLHSLQWSSRVLESLSRSIVLSDGSFWGRSWAPRVPTLRTGLFSQKSRLLGRWPNNLSCGWSDNFPRPHFYWNNTQFNV